MHVAIVGGGYAGLAAAVKLADQRIPVTLYEAAQVVGGRARRVVLDGTAVDNGQHILIGAYRETLRLVGLVNPDPDALLQLPLDWQIAGEFRLHAPSLPAPLHLLAALLTASGMSLGERFAAVRFMQRMRTLHYRLERDITVRALLGAYKQGTRITAYLWNPLCIAALNTPPEHASAQIFLNVLRDGLDAERAASNLLLARSDLSALFPEPAARYVQNRGGTVHTGSRVTAIDPVEDGFTVSVRSGNEQFSHVICATAPHHALAFLAGITRLAEPAEQLARMRYQPIYTVYLKFAEPVTLSAPMLGLAGGLTQWVFDRGAISGDSGLLAAIISAEGAHQTLTLDELAQRVEKEIREKFGIRTPLSWQRVIAEKRATFACTPGLQRPPQQTALRNFYLAGDYTAGDYPATLEAAVRSGIACAQHIIDSGSRDERREKQPATV